MNCSEAKIYYRVDKRIIKQDIDKMLKELLVKFQKLSREHVPFNPSRFDDPVAATIEWTPAKGGGANFKTHNLVQVSRNRIVFRSSICARIFYGVFLLMGLGIVIASSYP